MNIIIMGYWTLKDLDKLMIMTSFSDGLLADASQLFSWYLFPLLEYIYG